MSRSVILSVLLGLMLLAIGVLSWQKVRTREHVTSDNPPVARVHQQYLYKGDIAHLTTEEHSPAEQAKIRAQYIHHWITQQLLIAAAGASGTYNQTDIEQKVLAYRHVLLAHSFIEKQVDERLQRDVSDEEVAHYHQTHQDNFMLRSNIFKGQFVVLPREAPDTIAVKALLLTKDPARRAALQDYCQQFAQQYSLEGETWLPWDELIQKTPFSKAKDPAKLLSKSKLLQTSNKQYHYYFKIDDYRCVNEATPLELVRSQIADLIVHKRKRELANQIKEEILQKAQQNNDYTIYND